MSVLLSDIAEHMRETVVLMQEHTCQMEKQENWKNVQYINLENLTLS